MSEKEKAVSKRFFIQGTVDLHKRLQHLAIDLDSSAEKLAGQLLAEIVAQKEAELAKQPAPRKPR